VTGAATGGPQGVDSAATSPLPLSATMTFTPQPGEVSAIAAQAQFTLASATPPLPCQPLVRLLLNGQNTRVTLSQFNSTTTPTTLSVLDADGPFGLINPGMPMTVTATLRGDADCTPDSKLDRVEVRIVQFH
jgi:hypothetical protein